MIYNEIKVSFKDAGIKNHMLTKNFKETAKNLGFTILNDGIIGPYDSYDAIEKSTYNPFLVELKRAYDLGNYSQMN